MLLLIMLPLMALSIYMWATGKGSMLVAGFNTSPKAVRSLYDSTAFAKFVGMLVTAFSVILLLGMEALILFDSMTLFWIALIISLAILFIGLYYMNTGNRFLKKGASLQDVVISAEDRKRSRSVVIAGLAIMITILIAVFFFLGSRSVSVSLEDDIVQVSAPFVDEIISFEDVTSVELRDDIDNGRRVGGFGGTKVSSGNFENDEFGRYTLARYDDVDRCVVVHHSGGVLVFNLDTPESTMSMYDEILTKI